MISNQDELRQYLRRRLEELGWDVAVLAERADLNRASLYNFFSGSRRLGAKMLRGISKALDESPEKLFRMGGLIDAALVEDEDPLWDELRAAYRQLGTTREKLLAIRLVLTLRSRNGTTDADDVRGGDPSGKGARRKPREST